MAKVDVDCVCVGNRCQIKSEEIGFKRIFENRQRKFLYFSFALGNRGFHVPENIIPI